MEGYILCDEHFGYLSFYTTKSTLQRMLSSCPSGVTISQTSADDVKHRHTCLTYVDFNQTCCRGCFLLVFIYFCLHCILVVACSLSVVVASRAYSLAAVHGLFSLQWFLLFCGARALDLAGSRVWSQLLWRTGLVAPEHVKSFQTRDGTSVPCIARWILNP